MPKPTNIRAVARFRMPDGREVNVKKGCKAGRNCDIYFYLNRGTRIYVSASDLSSWERLSDVPAIKSGKQLTVYSGITFVGSKQCRTIVAAYTKKRAMELLRVSASSFRGFWTATGHKESIEKASSEPEVVFVSTSMFAPYDFKRKAEVNDD